MITPPSIRIEFANGSIKVAVPLVAHAEAVSDVRLLADMLVKAGIHFRLGITEGPIAGSEFGGTVAGCVEAADTDLFVELLANMSVNEGLDMLAETVGLLRAQGRDCANLGRWSVAARDGCENRSRSFRRYPDQWGEAGMSPTYAT